MGRGHDVHETGPIDRRSPRGADASKPLPAAATNRRAHEEQQDCEQRRPQEGRHRPHSSRAGKEYGRAHVARGGAPQREPITRNLTPSMSGGHMVQTVFGGRPRPVLVITLSFVLGWCTTGFAQADDFLPPLPRVRSAMERPVPRGPFGPRGTDLTSAPAVSNTRRLSAAPARANSQRRMPTAPPSRRGSRARQVTAGIIGGVLGMWAGAALARRSKATAATATVQAWWARSMAPRAAARLARSSGHFWPASDAAATGADLLVFALSGPRFGVGFS